MLQMAWRTWCRTTTSASSLAGASGNGEVSTRWVTSSAGSPASGSGALGGLGADLTRMPA